MTTNHSPLSTHQPFADEGALRTWVKTLRLGDEVAVWFHPPDDDEWWCWTGKVTESSSESSPAAVQYIGGYNLPPPTTTNTNEYALPYPDMVYSLSSSVTKKGKNPPVFKPIVRDIPKPGKTDDTDNISDARSNEGEGKYEGESEADLMLLTQMPALACDPETWWKVCSTAITRNAASNAQKIVDYLKNRFGKVGKTAAEGHILDDILVALEMDVKSVVDKPGLCYLPLWVQGRKRLIARLDLNLQMKVNNYDARTIGVLASQYNQQTDPKWMNEARSAAALSLKTLTVLKGKKDF